MAQRMDTALPPELARHKEAIEARARSYGLDFHDVGFEVLDFETMNRIAAYGGFPVRYPHWRWGMEYERLSKRDAYGLGRIYEMVINNDPCYAYLQESNSVTDQKLVMAHVYGHADFFKTNLWFSKTNRKMIDEMANHATRVRRHIERQGADEVERFLDVCMTIERLIDPHSMFVQREASEEEAEETPFEPRRLRTKPYMEPFVNPPEQMEAQRRAHQARRAAERGRIPRSPTRDVLLFLLRHAPLEAWQHDILSIVRDESYYFAPQAMTKIMNEGWASYWHTKLLTQHFVEASEIIDYADQHSGVVHMPPGGFNPYKIGLELFKDVERRWDRGQHGHLWERLDSLGEKESFDDSSMKGRDKIFEVRRVHNDVTFIEEFLTDEFIEQREMYHYRPDPTTGELRVVTRDPATIRKVLLHRLSNMGEPYLYVVDANYLNRGELYLAQQWIGLDLEIAPALESLRGLRRIWGRPVHLQARIDDEMMLFSCEDPDDPPGREKIDEETPPPAHAVAWSDRRAPTVREDGESASGRRVPTCAGTRDVSTL